MAAQGDLRGWPDEQFLDREAAAIVGLLPPDTEHALAILDRAREILQFTDAGKGSHAHLGAGAGIG